MNFTFYFSIKPIIYFSKKKNRCAINAAKWRSHWFALIIRIKRKHKHRSSWWSLCQRQFDSVFIYKKYKVLFRTMSHDKVQRCRTKQGSERQINIQKTVSFNLLIFHQFHDKLSTHILNCKYEKKTLILLLYKFLEIYDVITIVDVLLNTSFSFSERWNKGQKFHIMRDLGKTQTVISLSKWYSPY